MITLNIMDILMGDPREKIPRELAGLVGTVIPLDPDAVNIVGRYSYFEKDPHEGRQAAQALCGAFIDPESQKKDLPRENLIYVPDPFCFISPQNISSEQVKSYVSANPNNAENLRRALKTLNLDEQTASELDRKFAFGLIQKDRELVKLAGHLQKMSRRQFQIQRAENDVYYLRDISRTGCNILYYHEITLPNTEPKKQK